MQATIEKEKLVKGRRHDLRCLHPAPHPLVHPRNRTLGCPWGEGPSNHTPASARPLRCGVSDFSGGDRRTVPPLGFVIQADHHQIPRQSPVAFLRRAGSRDSDRSVSAHGCRHKVWGRSPFTSGPNTRGGRGAGSGGGGGVITLCPFSWGGGGLARGHGVGLFAFGGAN